MCAQALKLEHTRTHNLGAGKLALELVHSRGGVLHRVRASARVDGGGEASGSQRACACLPSANAHAGPHTHALARTYTYTYARMHTHTPACTHTPLPLCELRAGRRSAAGRDGRDRVGADVRADLRRERVERLHVLVREGTLAASAELRHRAGTLTRVFVSVCARACARACVRA